MEIKNSYDFPEVLSKEAKLHHTATHENSLPSKDASFTRSPSLPHFCVEECMNLIFS